MTMSQQEPSLSSSFFEATQLDPRHHLGPRETADHIFAPNPSTTTKRKSSPTDQTSSSRSVASAHTLSSSLNVKQHRPRKTSSSPADLSHSRSSPTPSNSRQFTGLDEHQQAQFVAVQHGQHYSAWWEKSTSSSSSSPLTAHQQQQQQQQQQSRRRIRLELDLKKKDEEQQKAEEQHRATPTYSASTTPVIKRRAGGSSSQSTRNTPSSLRSSNIAISTNQTSAHSHRRRAASPPTTRTTASSPAPASSTPSITAATAATAATAPTKLPCVAHPTYTGHKDCGCLVGWSPPADRNSPNRRFLDNLPPVIVDKQKIQHIGPLAAAPRLRLISPHEDASGLHFPTVLTCERGSSEIWERSVFTGESVSNSPYFSLQQQQQQQGKKQNDEVSDEKISPGLSISAFCSMLFVPSSKPSKTASATSRKSSPTSEISTEQLLWVGCDQGSVRVHIQHSRSHSHSHHHHQHQCVTEPVFAHRGEVSCLVAVPPNLVEEYCQNQNDGEEDEVEEETRVADDSIMVRETNHFPVAFSASTDGQLKAWGLTRRVSYSKAKSSSSSSRVARNMACPPTPPLPQPQLLPPQITYKLVCCPVVSHLAGFRCMTLLDISPEVHVSRNPIWLLCAGCNDGVIKCWELTELMDAAKNIEEDHSLRKSLSWFSTTNKNKDNNNVNAQPSIFLPSRNTSHILDLRHQQQIQTLEPLFVLKGHQGAVRCICPTRSEFRNSSNTSTFSASTSFDRFHHAIGIASGTTTEAQHSTSRSVPAGAVGVRRLLWTGGDDQTIRVWSIPSLEESASLRFTVSPTTSGHRTPVCSLTAIKNHSIWSTDEEGRISIYKIDDTLHLVLANDTMNTSTSISTSTSPLSLLSRQNDNLLPSVTAVVPLAGHVVWLSSAGGLTSAIYVPGSLPKSNIDPKELTDLQDALDEQTERMEEKDALHRFELDEKMVSLQSFLDEKVEEMQQGLAENMDSKGKLIEEYGPNVSSELNQEFIGLLQDARTKLVGLHARNNELEHTHSHMSKSFDDSEKELALTRFKNKELASGLNEAKKKLALAEGRFIKARDDLAKETSRAERLEMERPRLSQAAEEAEARATEQTKRAVGAEAKIRGLKEETTRAQQKANLAEAQMKKLQQSIDDLTLRLNDAMKRTAQAESKNAQLAREKKEDSEKVFKMSQQCKQLEDRHNEAESKNSELLSSLQDHKVKLKNLSRELDAVKEKLVTTDDERLNLRMDLRNVKSELESERAKSVDQQRKMQQEGQEHSRKLEDRHAQEISDLKEKHYQATKALLEQRQFEAASQRDTLTNDEGEARDERAILELNHSAERNRLRELAASAEERASRQALEHERRISELRQEVEDERTKRIQQERQLVLRDRTEQQLDKDAEREQDERRHELERREKELAESSRKLVESLQKEKDEVNERLRDVEAKYKNQVQSNHRLVQIAELSEKELADLRRQLEESKTNNINNNNNNNNNLSFVSQREDENEKEEEKIRRAKPGDFVEPSAPSSPVSPTRLEKLLLLQLHEQQEQQQQQLSPSAAFQRVIGFVRAEHEESEQRLGIVNEQHQATLAFISSYLVRNTIQLQNNETDALRLQLEHERELRSSDQSQQQIHDKHEQKLQEALRKLQQKHRDELERIQDQLDQTTGQRNAAIRDNENLKQEFDQMFETMKDDLEQAKAQLRLSGSEQVSAIQKQLEEVKDSSSKRSKKLAAELEETKEQLDNTQQQLHKQQQLLRELSPKAQASEEEREKLKKNLTALKKDYEDLQRKTRERQDQTNDDLQHVRDELDALKIKLTSTQSENGQQGTELDVANKKIVSLLAEVEKARDEVAEVRELKKQLSRQKDACRVTKLELDQTSKDLEDTRARLDSFRSQMDALHEDFDSVTKELADTKSTVADCQKSEEVARQEMVAAQRAARQSTDDAREKTSQLSAVKREKEEIAKSYAILQSDHTTTLSELSSANSRVQYLDHQLSVAHSEQKETQEHLESTSKELASTQELYRKLYEMHRKLSYEHKALTEEMARSADEIRQEMRRELERHRVAHVSAKQKYELTAAELDAEKQRTDLMQKQRDDARGESGTLRMRADVVESKQAVTSKQLHEANESLAKVSQFSSALQIQLSQKEKQLEAVTFALDHARGQIGRASESSVQMKQELFATGRDLEKKSAALERTVADLHKVMEQHKSATDENRAMKRRIDDYEDMEKHYNEMVAKLPPQLVDGGCQTELTSKEISRLTAEVRLRQQQVMAVQKQLQALLDSCAGDEELRSRIEASFTLDSTLFPHDRTQCLYCNGCLCLRHESDFRSPGRQRGNLNALSAELTKVSRDVLRRGTTAASPVERTVEILPPASRITARDELREEIRARNKGLPPPPSSRSDKPTGESFLADGDEADCGDAVPLGSLGIVTSPLPPSSRKSKFNSRRTTSQSASPPSPSNANSGRSVGKNRAVSSPAGSPTNPVGEKQLKRRLAVLIRALNNNQSKQIRFDLSNEIARLRGKLAEISPSYANANTGSSTSASGFMDEL